MIWWKIYFWIYAIVVVLGSFVLVSGSSRLGDWIAFLIEIVLVIGVYLYAFNKSADSSKWRIVFWVSTVFWVINLIYEFILPENIKSIFAVLLESGIEEDPGIGWAWASFLFIVPAIYAVYRLSSQSTNQTSKKTSKK